MNNRVDGKNNNGHGRTDCEISAADVARETIFPKHTHTHNKAKCDDCGCGCLNSHLRNDDGRLASPSEPADKKYCGNSDFEKNAKVSVEDKTKGKDRSRPTNPGYKMIDPGDDSADAGKS